MARELLNKPDGFITATEENREFVIESIRKVQTHANCDDRITYWTLKLNEVIGNIKR